MSRVKSTNIAVPHDWNGRVTGIDKRPVPLLEISAPGPNYGDGSGVAGDVIGDVEHHGGAQKAVYAYAREELDWWEAELGRELADGSFGENLTTEGLVLTDLLINQRVRIGTTLLEVSVARTPCRAFAEWMGEGGWLKRFIARGDSGAYFRVVEPGEIRAGDGIELLDAPEHGITMGMAYRAKLGDPELGPVVTRAKVLPPIHQEPLERRFTPRP